MKSIGKVILLQGPVGPCFDKLHNSFLKQNIDCTRILFNAGDRLFCGNLQSAITFEGNLEDWSKWFKKYIENNKPTVVILFGSDRPIHTIARELCEGNEILVLCLEEGYFRPGFVALEVGGNNANSPLAGLLPDINSEFNDQDLVVIYSKFYCKKSFRNKSWYGFLYYTWSKLFSRSKQRKLFHKNINLIKQPFYWAKNFTIWILRKKYDQSLLQKLSNAEYHLVALQLDTDMQSRFQSNGWKKQDLITETIKSFALNTYHEKNLVFKVHPLERGHFNHEKFINKIAESFGIKDKVFTVHTGSIGEWIKLSKGVITINSTCGISAIYYGVPILLLGNAIYDNEELVYKLKNKKDLDSFWTSGTKSDYLRRYQYLSWIKEESCIDGDFYLTEKMNELFRMIIKKITFT